VISIASTARTEGALTRNSWPTGSKSRRVISAFPTGLARAFLTLWRLPAQQPVQLRPRKEITVSPLMNPEIDTAKFVEAMMLFARQNLPKEEFGRLMKGSSSKRKKENG
jgi:hypothetical protein